MLRFAEEAVRPATAEMRCGDGASILRATIPRRPCGGACSSMLPRGASACQGMPGQAGASQGRRRRRGPDRRDERCSAFCWCANLRVPTARLANLGSRAHDTTDGLPGLPPLSDPAMPVKDPTRSLSCHFHRAAPSVSGLGRPSSTTTVHLHVPPATARSRPWPCLPQSCSRRQPRGRNALSRFSDGEVRQVGLVAGRAQGPGAGMEQTSSTRPYR